MRPSCAGRVFQAEQGERILADQQQAVTWVSQTSEVQAKLGKLVRTTATECLTGMSGQSGQYMVLTYRESYTTLEAYARDSITTQDQAFNFMGQIVGTAVWLENSPTKVIHDALPDALRMNTSMNVVQLTELYLLHNVGEVFELGPNLFNNIERAYRARQTQPPEVLFFGQLLVFLLDSRVNTSSWNVDDMDTKTKAETALMSVLEMVFESQRRMKFGGKLDDGHADTYVLHAGAALTQHHILQKAAVWGVGQALKKVLHALADTKVGRAVKAKLELVIQFATEPDFRFRPHAHALRPMLVKCFEHGTTIMTIEQEVASKRWDSFATATTDMMRVLDAVEEAWSSSTESSLAMIDRILTDFQERRKRVASAFEVEGRFTRAADTSCP